jgi:single-strand DNA-binding protein
MSINKAIILGFAAKDPEIREVGGVKCATFSVPTTKKFKGKDGNIQEKTAWHNIVCWRNTADIVENYVKKGTQIYIEGEIDYRSWESNGEKKYATDIVASTLQLLGSKKDSQSTPQSPAPQQKPKTTPLPTTDNSDGSDDLPW